MKTLSMATAMVTMLGLGRRNRHEGATRVVDAGDFVRDVCMDLRERAARKRVQLVVFATCGGVRVHVDDFSEALFNLVDTAVDAAVSGSSVLVTARPASVSGDTLWGVVDDGLGRPANEERTQPAHGITLAQLAVERHGGVLHYEAEAGRGSAARVWLPKTRAECR